MFELALVGCGWFRMVLVGLGGFWLVVVGFCRFGWFWLVGLLCFVWFGSYCSLLSVTCFVPFVLFSYRIVSFRFV